MTWKFEPDPSNRLVFKGIERSPNNIRTGIRRGSYISGQELTQDVRSRMTNGPQTGRTYTIYKGRGGSELKRPRRHTASGPGEYPAVITGELRKSVDFKVRGQNQLEFGAGGKDILYAKPLEVGTRRIAARRYLKQTVDRLGNKVKTNVSREINKRLKGSGIRIEKV
jgi:hypothetical protein